MKRIFSLLFLFCSLVFVSCHKERHFISDEEYRAQVHEDFLKRKDLAAGRADQLFAGMDTLDTETREALEFLYAYMPYSDLADYDLAFYLQQVRAAFKARETFAWGKSVPEDIFRHFVLVYRVNNENLDTARLLMQRELAPRLEGLSMYEAALEVNHWCHEHVAYRASDSRTSAPLATMRTSLGRCGEESTFTVTALRSVGIPARQCYTPRWAHCDDNHAWVEVYIADSNKWYFMGACEPDPELDMGWFAVPSTRCMMVHSNAFGRYRGDEEVNFQNHLFAKINMLPNYAPTKKVTVTVKDKEGRPVKDADVKFKLYNYSEFYPLATVKTDDNGISRLTTGLGDLRVWATDGEHYNYIKLDVRQQDSVEIYLTRDGYNPMAVHQYCDPYTDVVDNVPPVAGVAKVTPSKERADRNAARLLYEDSLRNAYVATFPNHDNYLGFIKVTSTPKASGSLKGSLRNFTDEQLWEVIHKSEGNYREIISFIEENYWREPGYEHAYDYLKSFSDKDLRDITCETLEEHFCDWDAGVSPAMPYDVYCKGIMPARISNEMVRPWREFLAEELTTKTSCVDASDLKEWTLTMVSVDDEGNYYNCPISPRGVYELGHADAHSRDIFFVAACRALYIPAYLDNATNLIYVWEQGKWNVVSFEEDEARQPTATLTLTYKPTKELAKPTYWQHFTLAKYEKGDFVTFDFEDDERMNKFPAKIDLEPGYYCLTTGNRYPDGEVLVSEDYFIVNDGQRLTKEIVLRPLVKRLDAATATVNPDLMIVEGMATLADYAGNTGMLFISVGDYKEPSKHLVKEIQSLEKEYKAWGGMIYLVAPSSAKPVSWKLPNADCMLCEPNKKDPLEQKILEALKLNLRNDYPLVAVINNKGQILFSSHGYSIGLAEQILKRIKGS